MLVTFHTHGCDETLNTFLKKDLLFVFASKPPKQKLIAAYGANNYPVDSVSYLGLLFFLI